MSFHTVEIIYQRPEFGHTKECLAHDAQEAVYAPHVEAYLVSQPNPCYTNPMLTTLRAIIQRHLDDWGLVLIGIAALVAVARSLYHTAWNSWGIASYALGLIVTILVMLRLRRSRAEAEQRVRQLTTLNAISNAMRASLDLPELFEAIHQHIGQLLEAPDFYVALYNADTTQVSFPLFFENGQRRHQRPRPAGNTLLDYVSRTREPLLIQQNVAQAAARLGVEPIDQPLASWLGVPILTNTEVLGVIVVQSQTKRAFDQSDVELLTTVASQAAVAISNAQLYSTLRQRATELAILNSASSATGATLDLNRLLEIIITSIGPVTACQKAAIFLLNDNGDELFLAHSHGLSAAYVEGAQHIKAGPGERGMVAAMRRPLVVGDISSEPGLRDFVPMALAENFRALAEVPLQAQNSVIGTLAIYYAEPHPFTQSELDLLQTFANQAAAAVNNARLYERTDQALARRVEELAALEEIGREFTGTLDVSRIAESIVERTRQVTGAQVAALMLMDEDGSSGHFVAQRGFTRDLAESLLQKPWPATRGIVGRAVRTGQVVNVPDVRLDPDHVVTDPQVRSQLTVSIVREGHVLGVLSLGSYELAAFDRAAVAFTQQIANQAAIALENARLFAERTRRIEELSQLYQASLALTGSLDLQYVLGRIVTATFELTFADTVTLHLYDSSADQFQLGASAGTPLPGDSIGGIRQQGMTRRAMLERRPVLIGDTCEEPDTNARLVALGVRSLLLVPLISHNQVLGVLNVYSSQAHKFTDADVRFVSALGNQAAAAIENARLFQAVAEVRDKMRAILDSSSDGILMFDLTGRVAMANPALEKLVGIQRQAFEGHLLHEMLESRLDVAGQLGYSLPAILTALDQLKHGEHPVDTHSTFQITRPMQRFLERSGLPVQDDAGRLIGWMIILRDVTEQRELEQMRADLTSLIIHDLRSPLSAIYSGILLLRELTPERATDETTQGTFTAAEQSCLKLIDMVNSLLDISRLEAGRMKLEQKPAGLNKLEESAVEGLIPLAKAQGITIACDMPQIWQVLVDDEKIVRVLTNLLDNALKFSPVNGLIRVIVSPEPGQSHMVRCGVHDEGPGISPEYRDKIFDRFTQGPGPSSRRRGTGLGLTFCKLAIEAHGGRIWVESPGAHGSVFYFTLPIANSERGNEHG